MHHLSIKSMKKKKTCHQTFLYFDLVCSRSAFDFVSLMSSFFWLINGGIKCLQQGKRRPEISSQVAIETKDQPALP